MKSTRSTPPHVALVRQQVPHEGDAKPEDSTTGTTISNDTLREWEKAAQILEEKNEHARRYERLTREVQMLRQFVGTAEWIVGLRVLSAANQGIPIGGSVPKSTLRYWLAGVGFVTTSKQITTQGLYDLSKVSIIPLSKPTDDDFKQMLANYYDQFGYSSEPVVEYFIRGITSVARGAVVKAPQAGSEPRHDGTQK